jgi:hypothetical protein
MCLLTLTLHSAIVMSNFGMAYGSFFRFPVGLLYNEEEYSLI